MASGQRNATPTEKSAPFPEKTPRKHQHPINPKSAIPNPQSNRPFVCFVTSWFPQCPVVPAADSNMEKRSDIAAHSSTAPAKRVSPIYWALLPTAQPVQPHRKLRERQPHRPSHPRHHKQRRKRIPRLDPPDHLPRHSRSQRQRIPAEPARLAHLPHTVGQPPAKLHRITIRRPSHHCIIVGRTPLLHTPKFPKNPTRRKRKISARNGNVIGRGWQDLLAEPALYGEFGDEGGKEERGGGAGGGELRFQRVHQRHQLIHFGHGQFGLIHGFIGPPYLSKRFQRARDTSGSF